MELLQLRYFQTVARMESVTAAANYYNIPQPAMSQAISRLEESLGGVRLFDRRNGRLFLNDVGREFLDSVDRSLMILDEAISKVNVTSPENVSGLIRLKVMDNQRLILTSIPKFLEKYPNVNLSVSHGYHEDQNVYYDMCVASYMTYKNMTLHIPIIMEHLVLAVHENHPLARKKLVTVEDLKGQKLVSLPPQSKLYELTMNFCNSAGFAPDIPIVCDDPYYIRKYISENIGVSLSPEISWRGRFRENTVLIPVVNAPVLTTYIVMDAKKHPSKAVETFRNFIIEESKKTEGNLLVE